jgi:putative methyltransferase (TIGR04325 family)
VSKGEEVLPEFLSGRFETLQSAKEVASRYSNGLNSFTSSRWLLKQESFWNESLSGNFPRPSTLPEIIEKSKTKTVCELGGGSGWIWNLIGSEVKRDLKYINIELAETSEYFKNLAHIDPAIRFTSSLEDLELNSIFQLMLYSNSTIQYIDDSAIKEIFRKLDSCSQVLFDELIFTDFESYWTLQEYYGSKIPYFVRNKSDFLDFMGTLGFMSQTQEFPKRNIPTGDELCRSYFTENIYLMKTC